MLKVGVNGPSRVPAHQCVLAVKVGGVRLERLELGNQHHLNDGEALPGPALKVELGLLERKFAKQVPGGVAQPEKGFWARSLEPA